MLGRVFTNCPGKLWGLAHIPQALGPLGSHSLSHSPAPILLSVGKVFGS